MNKATRKIIICFYLLTGLILLQSSIVRAQELPTYRFQYLLIEDGLPQNTIKCIAKDSYGYMWFGTNNGICRHDSYSFTSYHSEGKGDLSLPDNLINDIAIDQEKRILVASSGGISLFDPLTNKFNVIRDTSGHFPAIENISSLVVDGNQIWAGSDKHGIFRMESHKGKYMIADHYTSENSKIQSNFINVIYRDMHGAIHAGGNQAAYILNKQTDVFEIPSDSRALPAGTNVNDIFEDRDGSLYFSTSNGLFVHQDDNLSWYAPDPGNPDALQHATINMVRQDINGQILVATFGGLHAFFPEEGVFRYFPQDGHKGFIINNDFINTIYCDQEGNVWIGTDKGGVNKYNIYQNPFKYYTNDPNDSNSLNVNTINSLYDEKENLWIGTAGGGLNKLNKSKQLFSHITHEASNLNSLSSNYISAITRGSDGKLWVGTWGEGLNAVRTTNNRIYTEQIAETNSRYENSLVDDFVSTLVNDTSGFLLIGTQGGLSMLNYNSKRFTTLLTPDNFEQELTEIGCAILDSRGYYWIGTRDGLFRFPKTSLRITNDSEYIISQLEYYKHLPGFENGLPGNYIISLFEDSKRNIWIGTYGNGLARACYNVDGVLNCNLITTENGLSNNVIYGILEDNEGRIWLSTDNGLSMLDPETDLIKRFYKDDGLLNNQFYWSAACKGADGMMYFGSVEGLNYFEPEEFYDYNYFPQPRITSFKIHNKEVLPGVSYNKTIAIDKPIYNSDTIHLTYKNNNISFEFSSFDYYLPEKSLYEYMLQGVDKEWIKVTANRRFANYNYLEGGTYTILLRASNCDGLWNEEPTEVTVFVKPPFWQTGWFITVTSVFCALLVFLIIRLQLRRIIVQKRQLEEKVIRRTQKIEDQKVILEKQAEDLITLNTKVNEVNQQQLKFFTNISHEFQAPLTLIISPVERLLQQFKEDKEAHYLLSIVNRNSQRLLMLIRQLLEIRKIESGHQTTQVELTEAKPFMTGIFTSFEELAEKNSIRFTNDIIINKPIWLDKVKLENVLYNLLSNAFKFTPSGEKVALEASITKKDSIDMLRVCVSDTGTGIPADQLDQLFIRFVQLTRSRKHRRAGTGIGLSMVKGLVELMHGTISVESEVGKGSKFAIEIPVSRDAFDIHEIDTTGQVYESRIRDRVAMLDDQLSTSAQYEYSVDVDALETILVVEDNEDMRSYIASNLAQFYRVIEAENGIKGYKLAQKEIPSIILSDVMMPEMNGMDLCRKLKNNLYTSHIPLILLTAKSKEEDHIAGLELGADDYITKPFNIELLVAKIRTLVQNRNKVMDKFSRLEDVTPDEMKVSELDNKFFIKADEIVRKYYSEPSFDVDQFASEMLVSRSQLYSKLKAITNLSANEFINTYRLKKSVELLQQGDFHISEVAYATGFNDPKYFSRIFKKYYHKPPSELLKK